MKTKKLQILAISLLTSYYSFGQIGNGITNYTVTIPSTTVTTANLRNPSAFVIDNTGNKWIGFAYYIGSSVNSFQLIRYNGTQWDTFPAFNAIYSLNKVHALAVDASNNLWIGSNRGLTKYDGTTFTTYNTTNSTIKSDTIISLACNSGNVYAGSYKGLSVYNGTTFTNYNRATNGMKSDTVYCITAESASAVWLGNRFGMDKFDGSTFTFSYVAAGNVADAVNCIYIDATNNKWIGTNAHGVIKYNNTNFYTMQQLYPPSTLQDLIGYGGFPTIVKSICQGPNGGVLFGTIAQTYSSMPPSAYGCIEITNTQLYYYSNLNVVATGTASYYGMLQHDVGSNKIFFVTSFGSVSPNTLLYSFDVSQYSDSLDVSTATTAFLDINNVNALICPNSQQHWDNTSGLAKYFVPKQNNTSPLKASAMWIGGYSSGNLRVAAMTYRQCGYDFWPGPIDPATGTIDNAMMLAYNKVWKVNRYDIANFTYNWTAGNVQSGTFSTPASILNWPGNSPYGAGQLAPYVDVNSNGIYDPLVGGDYPLIKGDQMIWSVYNDAYNKHGETGSTFPLGIEVRASAYAFTCPNIADSNVVLNNTTFYNYQVINRSADQYDSTRMSLWMDTDLGDYIDDMIGCNVMNNFGYTYNGENYDYDVGANPGYHSNLPVFACNVLNGPLANPGDGIDNNNNGIIDEPNEHCLMDGFIYYTNTSSPNGNPNCQQPIQYYNFMHELWKNFTAMTYGNTGLTAGGIPCRYLFPGTSDPYGIGLGGSIATPVIPTGSYGSTGWTQIQGGLPMNDMRFMVNIGPFTMKPDSSYQLDYALVFSQDSAHCYGNDTCPINRAVKDNQRVKRWFNANSYPSCLSLVGVGIKQNMAQSIDFKLYPNPANSVVYIELDKPLNKASIEVYDMLGKVICGLQYNEAVQYVSIPLNDFQSGMYMVKIQTNEGTSIKKFVKE
ncbi:MAG: Periplasmic ligand-binding sensor domain-containing protein [Bacteroidia bacterium]